MKILFFIGTLCSGGKERRLIELLSYLKKNSNYNLMVVLRGGQIDFPRFKDLNIPYKILTENYIKIGIKPYLRFYKICKEFKPDIIHTWGSIEAFMSLLPIILLNISHINSQITDAPSNIKKWNIRNIINKINFKFSTFILSNSYEGLKVYKAEKKNSMVIYNGINLERFKNLHCNMEIKKIYGINNPYSVIMVASFSINKDYDRFINVAKHVSLIRSDISFIAVGDGDNIDRIKSRVIEEQIPNIIFLGKITNVEDVVSVADIGVLFSNKLIHGEGISNSILEYMALGKAVIANDTGGTKEIIKDGVTGNLISNETPDQIAKIIISLIDDKNLLNIRAEICKNLIYEKFSIDIMGYKFYKLYKIFEKNYAR
jgi:glycosyltransferase involved in cell wall biosynthesis